MDLVVVKLGFVSVTRSKLYSQSTTPLCIKILPFPTEIDNIWSRRPTGSLRPVIVVR